MTAIGPWIFEGSHGAFADSTHERCAVTCHLLFRDVSIESIEIYIKLLMWVGIQIIYAKVK